jgi:hypothetical protein
LWELCGKDLREKLKVVRFILSQGFGHLACA